MMANVSHYKKSNSPIERAIYWIMTHAWHDAEIYDELNSLCDELESIKHMVAAAPEMYEALKKTMAWLEGLSHVTGFDGSWELYADDDPGELFDEIAPILALVDGEKEVK